jgi:hypothetical protein
MLSEEAFNRELSEEANRIAAGRAAFRPLARGVEVSCDGVCSHLDTRELYRAYAAGLPAGEPIAELARTLVAQSEGMAEIIERAADFDFARRHLFPQFLPEGLVAGRGVGRSWLAGLDLAYVLDSDDWWQLVVVTESMRRSWATGEEELFAIALANLAAVPAAPTCVVPGRAYAFHGGERPHFNAVQVLLPDQMRHLADLCEESVLRVEVPFRGFAVAYVPGEEEQERRLRRQLLSGAVRHAYRLSPLVYVWRDGSWEVDEGQAGAGR